MEQAEVSPELLKDPLPRLNHFPPALCCRAFSGPRKKRHALEYIDGLGLRARSTKLARGLPTCTIKNGRESRSSSDMSPGIIKPMLATLAVQVGQELGEADGVIVFDPSAFPKKGD